jgi:hypothetical protein
MSFLRIRKKKNRSNKGDKSSKSNQEYQSLGKVQFEGTPLCSSLSGRPEPTLPSTDTGNAAPGATHAPSAVELELRAWFKADAERGNPVKLTLSKRSTIKMPQS